MTKIFIEKDLKTRKIRVLSNNKKREPISTERLDSITIYNNDGGLKITRKLPNGTTVIELYDLNLNIVDVLKYEGSDIKSMKSEAKKALTEEVFAERMDEILDN